MEGSVVAPPKPWRPVLLALLLLSVLAGLLLWQWQVYQDRQAEGHQQRFQLEAQEIGQQVLARMQSYEMVLRGVSGLLIGSADVSQAEWDRALDQLQLQDHYPGIQAVAWSRFIRAEQLGEFLARQRAQGRLDYQVFPEGERQHYLPIDYVSPLDWRNRRALGFDMFSETVRQAAIERAIETGEASLSGPVVLRQETEINQQPGVLLFLPVFQSGKALNTAQERRAALLGLVHGAFRIHDLIEGILGLQSRRFDIVLADRQASDSPLLSMARPGASQPPLFASQQDLELYGRTWSLKVFGTAEYERAVNAETRQFNLWAGGAVAVLLALLVGSYLYQRDRKQYTSALATAKLKEREERFRLLIERLPVATLLCSDSGRIEIANRSAAELLGCTVPELIGESVLRVIPNLESPHDLPAQLADSDERTLRTLRGDSVPVSISLNSLYEGSGYLLNLVDLRARKVAEERFRLVVEASPNAILLVDGMGRIAMVNRQTELLFGYERQALLGEPVEMLLPTAQRGNHVALRRGYQAMPEQRRMGGNRELFGQHREGRMIPLEVGLSPIRSGDENLVQAVIIDISERKAAEHKLREQAEQLLLANRYKSEFLANMSHELRTPLNSILILSDQLRQNVAGNLTEKQTKHADIVYRAGSDLLQLINDVLDLAKVEAGRIQIKLEPINMQDVLVELDASLRPMAEVKGLRLHTQLDAGVPRVVHTDRVRLHQILRNLLSNALKFTDRGEVTLTVSSEGRQADERELLCFCVQDTGIGIDPAQHEQVFQAFQQIDGSTSRRFGGTGLGLAITRQLVMALDGDISLQSTPGQGSAFTVRLPVQTASASVPEAQYEAPQRAGEGPPLLIVEDDANFAAVIAEEAHAHGFSSVQCRTGLQALTLLQHETFAAVILDILLPDLSGWQLFRRLRAQPSHRHTPVHIISCVPQPAGWNDDGTRYLVKPIGRDELEQVFVELGHGSLQERSLLLVEDVEAEREHYREQLTQLGLQVTACADAEQACACYAQGSFAALVIDLDLPEQDGFVLLDRLNQIRPLQGTRVVINTGVDVTQQSLQRLRRYSAVVVCKQGEDSEALCRAVQGFLGDVRAPEPTQVIHSPLQGRRILLVDDDVRNLYAMTALLDEVGLCVTAVKDGLEAIASFQQEPFELILMDMAMPNMDGYTATRLLKEEHDCGVPIIALTAHAMKGDREKCIAAGADDYMAKPVKRDELLVLLERWLGASVGAPSGNDLS
ncbi:CHASE domain-containing protein [Pseudomonas sp. AA-38]|uniref:CHASE domain-containing protein n=1 Tax=Pseudomonas sp. AA-38 TaxID=3028807 RepID=UPI0023F87824|nr:CHASE domain-containing protein [Pseudomonas sp. AA-38]